MCRPDLTQRVQEGRQLPRVEVSEVADTSRWLLPRASTYGFVRTIGRSLISGNGIAKLPTGSRRFTETGEPFGPSKSHDPGAFPWPIEGGVHMLQK